VPSTSRSRRHKNYPKLWAYFAANPCRCGETNPILLQLNHRDPRDKHRAVSALMNCSWTTIERELAKCESMCVRCHAIHTAATGNFYDEPTLRTYLMTWRENRQAYLKCRRRSQQRPRKRCSTITSGTRSTHPKKEKKND